MSTSQFLRLPQVEATIGVKKSFIYKREREGRFPRRIKLGSATVWSARQVEDWKQAQAEGRDWESGASAA